MGGGAGAQREAGAGLGDEPVEKVGRDILRYLRDRISLCKIFSSLVADIYFLARSTEPCFSPDLTSVRRATLGRWSGMLSMRGGGGDEYFHTLFLIVFSYKSMIFSMD